jgi:pimeloyl-ACP methyl ester carboxylesterase
MSEHEFESHGSSSELIVVLHGLGGSRKNLEGILTAIRVEKPDADIFCPHLPYGGPLGAFTRAPMQGVVLRLMREISRHWDARRAKGAPYQSITFVGHSLGGVIARKLVILAYGETPGTAFEPEFAAYRQPSAFAPAITRIIMLAGLSRGWSVSSTDSWLTAFAWSVMQVFGETVAWVTGVPYTVFAVRRGAPFLIQTRLQWLALVMRSAGKWNPAISAGAKTNLKTLVQNFAPAFDLIQLLGTRDDVVSPEDMLDNNVEMENSNYFIIEVPNSTHAEIIIMDRPPNDRGRAIDQQNPLHQRYLQFKLALTTSRADLKQVAIDWEDVSDVMPEEPEWDVTDVVFVIHGIRDKGFWTQKIARRVKQFARTSLVGPKRITDLPYRSVTASYGYFAMAPFVLRPVRARKVAWLMDQYTEARVRYPNAKFSYVGHSNGTYLVARALKDYPAAKFGRIVFAGSVVRSDYDWQGIAKPAPDELCSLPRIEKVLNYVATSDWVVAAFPKAMQLFRSIDLGGAGHDGFNAAFRLRQAPTIQAALHALQNEQVVQLQYVEGRHDAAIREIHWGDIASFVVTGRIPWLTNAQTKHQNIVQGSFLESPGTFAASQPLWSRLLGHYSVVLFPVIVTLIVGFGAWLGWRIFQAPPCIDVTSCAADTTREVVIRVLVFLGYILAVRILVTRY